MGGTSVRLEAVSDVMDVEDCTTRGLLQDISQKLSIEDRGVTAKPIRDAAACLRETISVVHRS